MLCKKIDTFFMHQVFPNPTSCSCPPLFTLDTLLVFLDTIKKHRTCEEFLLHSQESTPYSVTQLLLTEFYIETRWALAN